MGNLSFVELITGATAVSALVGGALYRLGWHRGWARGWVGGRDAQPQPPQAGSAPDLAALHRQVSSLEEALISLEFRVMGQSSSVENSVGAIADELGAIREGVERLAGQAVMAAPFGLSDHTPAGDEHSDRPELSPEEIRARLRVRRH